MQNNSDTVLCKRCVMPISVVNPANVTGCKICSDHSQRLLAAPYRQKDSERVLNELLKTIRNNSDGLYDCIVGVSGGVDSSYIAFKAKELGLIPLLVHVDNGWNSVISYQNIAKIVEYTGFDLASKVLNWAEFRDIQRSFFYANVVDLELPTDHAIFASLVEFARQYNIKYILSGTNLQTEGIMGHKWTHFKFDVTNIREIHKKFGEINIPTYPTITPLQLLKSRMIFGIKSISILNYIRYKKSEAKQQLINELGWIDYGGKHYESVFTKVYQTVILNKKFKLDKRFAHLSNLILNDEISRVKALEELSIAPYDDNHVFRDLKYIQKKLQLEENFWDRYFNDPCIPHEDYKSNAEFYDKVFQIYKKARYK